MIDRRRFLIGSGAALGLGALALSPLRRAFAADALPTAFSRKVLNITLEGGPDFRHVFVPPPNAGDGVYGQAYWKYRASSHYLGDNPGEWASRYSNDYLPVTSIAGVAVPEFGVLKRCAWLHSEIVAGRVAIVANVEYSNNRDHAHSLLILGSGDPDTTSYQTDRDGWGGRLANAVGGNVFSMTPQKHLFCNIPKDAPDSVIVSARDTRVFGLAKASPDDWNQNSRPVSDRALTSYYEALRGAGTVGAASPYAIFTHNEEILRGFTNAVRAHLGAHPVPEPLAALFSGEDPVLDVRRNFGEQARNVYDCFACEDLRSITGGPFNFRVGSMNYGGWDSHKNMRDHIEPQLEEIFGTGMTLDTLRASLQADMPAALGAHVTTVAGEFGRQLRSNGDRGTDHGRGNCFLVMGDAVRGGVYGELFPMDEVTTLVDGQHKYERFNQDIEGRTALVAVLGAISDWVANDELNLAGDVVVPTRATAIVEEGVTMTRAGLFHT